MVARNDCYGTSLFTYILKSRIFVYLRSIALASFTGLISLSNGIQANAQKSYRYSPYEKPDPFNPGFFAAVPKEALPPLQTIPLDRLLLVGTLIGKSPTGLISTTNSGSDAKTYLVRVGDKIGIRSGTIVSILKDRLIVREPLDPGDTREYSRFQDTALMLRSTTNQNASELITDLTAGDRKVTKGLTEALVEDVMPTDPSAAKSARRQTYRNSQSTTKRAEYGTLPNGIAPNNKEATTQSSGRLPPPPGLPVVPKGSQQTNSFSNSASADGSGEENESVQLRKPVDSGRTNFGQQPSPNFEQKQQLQNLPFSQTIAQPLSSQMQNQVPEFGGQASPTQSIPSSSLGGNNAPVR